VGVELIKVLHQSVRKDFFVTEVIWCKDITGDRAEDNLHLIEPTGVLGEPENANLRREVKGSNPTSQLFWCMSGAIVQNEIINLQL